jgi:Tfp pilus assembly protein FimV
MKNIQFLPAFCLILTFLSPRHLWADEAFVVLEYNSFTGSTGAGSGGYLVQPGDTLARIVAQHYGHVADQQDIFQQIVAQNPRAFVGGDPNRLLSGVVLNLSGSGSVSGNSRDEIYFF